MTSIAVAVGCSIRDGLRRVVADDDADLLVVGAAHRGPLGRVLLGDDASSTPDGVKCAVAIAPRGLASNPVTHHELARTGSYDARAVRIFEERKHLVTYAGVDAEVLEGDAGEAFTELSGDVDLIVLGSRGQGLWGRLANGSTSAYLVRDASCPVFILPRGLNPAEADEIHRPRIAATAAVPARTPG